MKQTIFTLLGVLLFAGAAFAQDTKPADAPPPAGNQPQDVRGNVLRELGLSQQQMQQIRRLNMARKPLMDDAQQRLRQATRALNQAIYADEVNESDFQARLKELQLAQAEVARLRFINEFAVRRILTPEQLKKFRDLQQRFEATVRDSVQDRRMPEAVRPNIRKQTTDVKGYQPGPTPIRPAPTQKRPNF